MSFSSHFVGALRHAARRSGKGRDGRKEAGTGTRGGLSNVKHVGTERVNVGGYMSYVYAP